MITGSLAIFARAGEDCGGVIGRGQVFFFCQCRPIRWMQLELMYHREGYIRVRGGGWKAGESGWQLCRIY